MNDSAASQDSLYQPMTRATVDAALSPLTAVVQYLAGCPTDLNPRGTAALIGYALEEVIDHFMGEAGQPA